MGERLQRLIDGARRDVIIMYLAARDPRVPFAAKFLMVVTLAYLLSPLDLIPDFIPVLGLLDDVVIIPFTFWISKQMIDDDVMEDLRVRAAARIEPLPKNVIGAAIVIAIWIAIAAAIWLAVVELHD